MHRLSRAWTGLFVAAGLAAAVLVGCSADDGGGAIDAGRGDLRATPDLAGPDLAAAPFCTDAPDGGAAPTLANVEALFAPRCAIDGCHDNGAAAAVAGLDLRPGHVYASVVGVAATAACGGVRVVAGDPAHSFLLHKLADATPCDGLQMPRCEDGSCPLRACEIDAVRRWIAAGAPAK